MNADHNSISISHDLHSCKEDLYVVGQLDHRAWDAAAYRPIPTIIKAAELLYEGHEVREIAHSSAGAQNLGATTDRLIEIIANAQQKRKHVVAFVTGVPGSGKTLAGLNTIHDPRFRTGQVP